MANYIRTTSSKVDRFYRQLEIVNEINHLMRQVRALQAEHEALSHADQPVYTIRRQEGAE